MELIVRYFPQLTDVQHAQLVQLGPLYQFWCEKVNVLARGELPYLYERHVLHSLCIAKIIEFVPGSKVLDLGTGGGFPGIPLAIYFPDTEFHLIDLNEKKTQVVQAIALEVGLQNVIIEKASAGDLRHRYDFVVCRAVKNAARIAQWGTNLLREESFNDLPNGLFMLKGGDLTKELEAMGSSYDLMPISAFFMETWFRDKFIVYVH